ncbi:hypothetical protein HK100_002730 [Physocladia obscura]|uniref:Uncharacterized protein n=1 Tax=Physocladia obscura TaxID=109957 RepID=A0AAD5XF77_9FUNG|nr:hypothetical protein HK100_002730 [Physocladia obscura]
MGRVETGAVDEGRLMKERMKEVADRVDAVPVVVDGVVGAVDCDKVDGLVVEDGRRVGQTGCAYADRDATVGACGMVC